MIFSLNCFCSFLEAKTPEQRTNIIKRYKKGSTGPAKGMMIYYKPALQIMRGRLCVDGSTDQKLAALREACIVDAWPDKLNDARIAANTLAYRAFQSEFGNKKLEIFTSPRLQCLVSADVAVNLQPEIFAKVDDIVMMWKFHMSKKSRSEDTIRLVLQMMNNASNSKGLNLSIDQIRFFDMRTGKIYTENKPDIELKMRLRQTATALTQAWNKK